MESTRTASPTVIQEELERVLASAPFANCHRSQKFLRYVVECSLKNQDEFLKEFAIAVDVFGRNVSYDPSINATVRVEAGRLRSRLREYYAGEGRNDPLIIDVPKGGYRATFCERFDAADAQPAEPAVPVLPVHAERRKYSELIWVGMVAILIAGVAGLAVWKKGTPHIGAQANGPKTLAILLFSNQTGVAANDYLSEGLTDNLIRQMSQLPDLRVISRAAAYGVNKQNASAKLTVDYLLTGEIQRNAEGRLVLDSELSNAKDGTVLRSFQYLPDESDLRPIQADIVQDVVKGLGISLAKGKSAAAQKPLTMSPAAFQDFLRGESAARRRDDPAGLHAGIQSFEDAVRLDPSFALAYSSMAEAHLALGIYYEPPREHMPLARQYAERALALDPSINPAHAVLGLIDLLYDWKLSAAQTELASADTRDSAIWQLACTAHLLGESGRFRHAREDLTRLLEFDPNSVMLLSEIGCVNYYAGQYDESIRDYHQALAVDSRSLLAYWGLGRSLGREGRFKEAVDVLRRFKTVSGFEPPVITAEIGYSEGASGDHRAASAAMTQLEQESKHIYVDPYFLAIIHLGLKDRAETYMWLDRAYQSRSPFLISIATDPKWDHSRDDPEFQRLWKRMTQAHSEPSIKASSLGL